MEAVFFENAESFRQWLEKNHHTAEELWVGYYKKNSGKANMSWSESVDEAICFGWIDGLRKSIDEISYKIRFTPRRPNSIWSAVNIKKVEVLTKKGLMHPAGKKAFEKLDKKRTQRYSFEQKSIQLPAAFEAKLKASKKAWKYLEKLAPAAKKLSIGWVMNAKREETRLRRLDILIKSSEEGKKIPPLRIGRNEKT